MTLLPPLLYNATSWMIRECIFCGSDLVLACRPMTWRLEFLVPSQSDHYSPPRNQTVACPTRSLSYCSISPRTSVNGGFSYEKKPAVHPAPSSPSAQPFGFLEKMESGSVVQRLQIGMCTDCLHMWTWIFWSFGITQSTAWHDRHIELMLIPCYVQEFDLAIAEWSVF